METIKVFKRTWKHPRAFSAGIDAQNIEETAGLSLYEEGMVGGVCEVPFSSHQTLTKNRECSRYWCSGGHRDGTDMALSAGVST